MRVPKPSKGQRRLLIYRECECGDWLATHEGAIAPRCGDCGGEFLPLGGVSPRVPNTLPDPKELANWQVNRLKNSLGAAAQFVSESEAVDAMGVRR